MRLLRTTLQNVKAFLSGIFGYAKRQGVINSENPMRDVVLPKAKPPERETTEHGVND